MVRGARKTRLTHLMGALALVLGLAPGRVNGADDSKEDEARRERQLQMMRRTVASVVLSSTDRKRPFKFHETAVMRWSNPVGGVKDGAIFIWSDRGRPQVIVKLYTRDFESYNQEWQSLAEGGIVAERDGRVVWAPPAAGLTFRDVPDAPAPGATAVERLRQMKTLAGKFSAIYTPSPVDALPEDLRLLVQPMFRYDASEGILDGALFGFSQGTDPLALLLVEARRNGDLFRWHYAFARLATGAVSGRHGDKEVFAIGKHDFNQDPKQTFLFLPDQPMRKD